MLRTFPIHCAVSSRSAAARQYNTGRKKRIGYHAIYSVFCMPNNCRSTLGICCQLSSHFSYEYQNV